MQRTLGLSFLFVLYGVCLAKEDITALQPAAKTSPSQSASRRGNITVLDDNWGGSPPANIEAICKSAAQELLAYFPNRTFDEIVVGNGFGGTPITLFKRGSAGELQVKLTTRGPYWSQYAYQFGHEYCHILCNFRNAQNDQLWFEESLCETASIFVVRKMADTWRTNPPYTNWTSYAASLENYADDHLSNTPNIEEKTFAEWYRNHRAELEKAGTDRQLNQVVAVKVLLPLLQSEPKHWEALSFLNQWDPNQRLTFPEYLKDWQQRVPDAHKSFVQAIANRFEIKID